MSTVVADPDATQHDAARYAEHGFSAPVTAAEGAIFEMFVHHRAVPVEQRTTVRAQLDQLATEDGVREAYQMLAAATRKRIKRLGRS